MGRLAPSEWTCSISGVSDTLTAEYSTRGIHAMCHVEYRPPITMSSCVRPLSVSELKHSVWCSGQLAQYGRMGSLSTLIHCDCNAIGDPVKICPCVPYSCGEMQFSHHQLYTSFEVARSMWLLTIHRSCHLSPLLLPVAIAGIPRTQPTMIYMLHTSKAMATGAFLTCIHFVTGSELPEYSGIVVSATAPKYSIKAPSSFRSVILNSHCSCHRKCPFPVP
jgi:hypothetical protein